jgi:hypothetical protein
LICELLAEKIASTSAASGLAGLGRAHSRNKAFLGLTQ